MNAEQFRKIGYKIIDICADYMDTLREREPLANVKPGYILKYIPLTAPEKPEPWEDILDDIEPALLQGVRTYIICILEFT